MISQRLGEILATQGHASADILAHAADQAVVQGVPIGAWLISQGVLSEKVVYAALADQAGCEFCDDIDARIDTETVGMLPQQMIATGRLIPLDRNAAGHRVVALSNPLDLDALALAGFLLDEGIVSVIAPPSALLGAAKRYGEDASRFVQSAGLLAREYQDTADRGDDAMLSLEEIKRKTEAEPIVKMVSLLFDEAIRQRASDIHIEPTRDSATVRLRVDGMLNKYMDLSRQVYWPVTSRIKILADIDIAEKRIPQDGRIRYRGGSAEYDFRVSTLPTHLGEKIVLRILRHDTALLELKNLGMPAHIRLRIEELIEKPQGMVIVTGPTGSGKSSTLCSALNTIKSKAINITTIENPIENKIDGVNQVQINEKAGISFASVLRSILRQDPDVILVGEIRDKETADIALQASQTGHLVFSTLHTNDALGAITRLRDLDIAGFLIASSLIGVVAQRLVRVLCPHCKVAGEHPSDVVQRWSLLMGSIPLPVGMRPRGCDRCGNSGYHGRIGLFELIDIDEALRGLIAVGDSESNLRAAARNNGFKPLAVDGIEKIVNGITTPEEILRVVLVDDALLEMGN